MATSIPWVYADPYTNYAQGVTTGQQQTQNALSLQQEQQAQSNQDALSNALSTAYTDPTQQASARQTLAANAPLAVPDYDKAIGQMTAQQQAAVQAKNQSVAQDLWSVMSTPAGPQREAAYQSILDKEQANGTDVSSLRGMTAEQGVQTALNHVQSIDAILKQSQPQSFDLAPGNTRVQYDPVTGKQTVLASAPTNAQNGYSIKEMPTGKLDANGQPIYGSFYVPNQPGGQPIPVGQGVPSGASAVPVSGGASTAAGALPAETQAYVPKVMALLGTAPPLNPDGTASQALLNAVQYTESANNPLAVSNKGAQGLMQVMPATQTNPGFGVKPAQDNSPQELQRVGNDYLNAMIQRYGGNVQAALAAYNAGPGTVDKLLGTQNPVTGQNASAIPAVAQIPNTSTATNPTATASPLSFGEFTKGSAADNVIQARQQQAMALKNAGVSFTPQQLTDYLTSGKYTPDANANLSPAQESLAQDIATYKLPVSAYSATKPGMDVVLQRVAQINPAWSAQSYQQNQKVLDNLASTSPTSAGGALIAAKTAIGHLDDLADISSKLSNTQTPSWLPFGAQLDQAGNALANSASQKNQTSVADWNQAEQLFAGELGKMVKGGQATDAEIHGLLAQLNYNSPNRDEALATAAKFMNDKIQAMEQQRDSILGTASPGTSYLNQGQQNTVSKLVGLSKNYDQPTFLPPQGSQSASAPATQNPTAPVPRGTQPMMANNSIPAGAIQLLRSNPALAAQFDAKYGNGASASVMSGQ